MTFGSLFAGVGGFDLGLERAGMTCLWQVEKDPYCLRVLEKHWPHVKRYEDIREVRGILADTEILHGTWGTEGVREGQSCKSGRVDSSFQFLAPVDLVCGGFPCQPFSVAGKRGGTADDRYLWPEMLRVIAEVRPAWVLGENVPGIVNLALDEVLAGLEAEGYETTTFDIPACAVDAPHKRARIWIVGYTQHNGRNAAEITRSLEAGSGNSASRANESGESSGSSQQSEVLADTASIGPESKTQIGELARQRPAINGERAWWSAEPDVGRVAHGVLKRVDRLKCLGNAVVPPLVEVIGKMILEYNTATTRGMGI